MKSEYYMEKLANLEKYQGFFPRTYIPGTDMTAVENPTYTAHQSLAIIDTRKEIEVGVGYDWSPVVLNDGEIQVNTELASYLEVEKYDLVNLSIGDIGLLNDAHMTAWTEDIYNFVSLFLEKDLVEGFKEDLLGADSNIDPVVM